MTEDCSYDTHTLYVYCEDATVDQLHQAMRQVVSDAKVLIPDLTCDVHVNLVCDRAGQSQRFAFVHVSNSALYNMLLGLSADGKERYAEVEAAPIVASDLSELWSQCSSIGSWADEEEETSAKRGPQLPPLISMKSIPLTSTVTTEVSDLPKEISFGVKRAMVTPPDEEFLAHVLKAKFVPSWVTASEVKQAFAPFVSDKEQYPQVSVRNGAAFVVFPTYGHEGQFALHMMKKLPCTKACTVKVNPVANSAESVCLTGLIEGVTEKAVEQAIVSVLGLMDEIDSMPHIEVKGFPKFQAKVTCENSAQVRSLLQRKNLSITASAMLIFNHAHGRDREIPAYRSVDKKTGRDTSSRPSSTRDTSQAPWEKNNRQTGAVNRGRGPAGGTRVKPPPTMNYGGAFAALLDE